jgi:hypothetical protein
MIASASPITMCSALGAVAGRLPVMEPPATVRSPSAWQRSTIDTRCSCWMCASRSLEPLRPKPGRMPIAFYIGINQPLLRMLRQ